MNARPFRVERAAEFAAAEVRDRVVVGQLGIESKT